MYFLFSELGIEHRYDANSLLLFVRLGEMRTKHLTDKKGMLRQPAYSIYVSHGSSGGRLPGGKANALSRMGQIVNADICILAHSHLPLAFRESCYQIDYQNSSYNSKETLFINASSTLGYGGYAERWQLRPVSLRYPILKLSGIIKDSDCTI